MDFHTLPRRDLQALCKKNRIPANLTNAAMADALGALPTVEGMDEPSQFQSPQKPEILSPDLPRTGRRTAARRAAPAPTPPPVDPEEPKEGQASPLPRARRVTAKAVAEEEEEAPEILSPDLPRTGRRTAARKAAPAPAPAPTPPPVAPEEPKEGQASPLPRARRVTAKAVAAEEEEAPEILCPDLPRTGRRTAARKAAPAPAPTPPPVAPEEPKEGQASPLPQARRVTAKVVAAEEEEAPEPEKADTPVARTGRKPRVLPTPVTRPTTRTRASKQAVEMAPTPATGTTGLKTKVVEVGPTPATGTTGLKTKKSSVKKTEEPLVATVNTGRSSRGRAAAKMTSLLQETATAATANAGRRSTRLRGVRKMASLVHETEEPECKEANREAQVGEDSDLCPSEPQAEIIETEKPITVSVIKKCQAIQEPLDSFPVEENAEGKVDSNSESQPLDSPPVEENAEDDGNLNTESEIVEEIQEPAEDGKECQAIQEPLDSSPVEENAEGDGDLNTKSEIVEEIREPAEYGHVISESEIKKCPEIQDLLESAQVEENVEDCVVSELEIKECQEVQVQEPLVSAPEEEKVEDGVASELEIKECQVQVQEPLGSAPVQENVEDGVVSESEIKECQEVQVQESLESASVEDNGEGGVNSELNIKQFQEVQVQEPFESAPVEDNSKDGANPELGIKEFQEVQEPLESAPVKDNGEDGAELESDIIEFQEVQEPLESAPVDENVECDGYPKPVSDDSPIWGLVDERSREGDVVEQSVDLDFHSDQTSFCDVSPVITKVFGDLSPINEAVEHSPPSDVVAEEEAEITVIVPDTIEAVADMVQTKEHFEEHVTVSEVVELMETEAINETDSIAFLSAFPAINVSEPFMVAEAEEHSDELLEVSEAVEHFMEPVAGSEAVVEQLVEHTASGEVKVLDQFVEESDTGAVQFGEVKVDSNSTEESDTAAASSPALLSPKLIATAAVLSFVGAEESYQQSQVTESVEPKSVNPVVAASSPPDLSTAVSPVKESSEVDLVLTDDVAEEHALAVDAMVVKTEDSSIAISLINEVAGEPDLHQKELKALANEVEKEPELSSDVVVILPAGDLATDINGGNCGDKENNDGEAKGKKPIRRHVVYSKLSMRKLKAILKERLAATAKNNTTGDGKKVEVKRTALRALDENQM